MYIDVKLIQDEWSNSVRVEVSIVSEHATKLIIQTLLFFRAAVRFLRSTLSKNKELQRYLPQLGGDGNVKA